MTTTATEPTTADATEAPDTPLQEAPYWQDAPCPPWCVVPHRDYDHPDDRWHDSEQTVIKLSLEAPVRAVIGDEVLMDVPELCTELTQGYREADARVAIIHNGSETLPLTLAEAALLRDSLTEMLDAADAAN